MYCYLACWLFSHLKSLNVLYSGTCVACPRPTSCSVLFCFFSYHERVSDENWNNNPYSLINTPLFYAFPPDRLPSSDFCELFYLSVYSQSRTTGMLVLWRRGFWSFIHVISMTRFLIVEVVWMDYILLKNYVQHYLLIYKFFGLFNNSIQLRVILLYKYM